jgi:hypothetical protein
MSLGNALSEIKSMGPFELIAFLLFIAFSLLLLLGGTVEAGPLIPLVKWGNMMQANFNQKVLGSLVYYKKATIFGFMFVAAIPYFFVRFAERRFKAKHS